MDDEISNEFQLVDAIASEAYLHLMVSYLICEHDLMAHHLAISEPNDPMDEWAELFSTATKKSGWVVSETGVILCQNCKDE